ncbi:MAG: hypothetical protein ABR953_09650 [Candidatus Acidiferrales bacterium]|jgi:hypothetical protein
MRRAILIFVCLAWLLWPGVRSASAQAQQPATSPASPAAQGGTQVVDGVAARIEDDIITDSEVRELAAFQQLVDGRSKPRGELIRELADQWIVRGEADAAKYPQPSADDVERAYAQLAGQFSSAEEFKKRCAAAGLGEAAVRRILAQQLYLSRFLDYRFRPAAQVDQGQLQKYYDDEFAPQLKGGQAVPPLEDVEDTIREVLVQRQINERAQQWLDNTRDRLKIDIMSNGDQP